MDLHLKGSSFHVALGLFAVRIGSGGGSVPVQKLLSKEISMSTWLGLRHVALNVRDVSKSVRFYQRVLGLKLEWQPDPENAYLTSGHDNLALHQVAPEIQIEQPFQKLDHFGFVVGLADDVDAWAKRLQDLNVPLEKEPKTHRDGARSFYFRDPDGNLVQILYHPHISGGE
jgi:catechol 2,3-dioxygenase-like lactoylglutathione lyase family enzyme